MKKTVIALSVVFAMGMVACGHSENADNAGDETVQMEEITDENVMVETPTQEIETGVEAVEQAPQANVEETTEADATTVKEKSESKVQEAKAKAKEASQE